MKVVYGHTDSIYIKIPTIKQAQSVVKIINNHVKSKFPNVMNLPTHPINLEFEKYFSTLGVGKTKNRNAGLISWKDGKYLDEPEFVMTGFTAKRISETTLAKEVQIKLLKLWIQNTSKEEILEYLIERYKTTLEGEIPLSKIIKRSRYKEERFHVYCNTCKKDYYLTDTKCSHTLTTAQKIGKGWRSANKKPRVEAGIVGILLYNSKHSIPIKDSYVYIKIVNNTDLITHPINQIQFTPNYIAGESIKDLEIYTPDWEHYAESIINKAKPVFNAMDWDIMEIKKDEFQKTLDEWW